MDQRRDHLGHWARQMLSQQLSNDMTPAVLSMVSGDASFRRYFRLTLAGQSWICVDAPADKEDNPAFVRIASQWRASGVSVPAVLAQDFELGFMLLEDFGDRLLWPALHDSTATDETRAALYRQAIDELLLIQKVSATDLPAYDEALLQREMDLFTDWLCTRLLGMTLCDDEVAMFNAVRAELVRSALAQPVVTVHRDYHSRNLMLCTGGDMGEPSGDHIGVIDFQDAVAGPVTYDLVSLLRDCYVHWSPHLVQELLVYYYRAASEQDIHGMPLPDFTRAFDLMGLQRHLKAAGIFARLSLRDGKDGYLASIPNTCRYLHDVSVQYPEFSEFSHWLETRFMPALEVKGL